MPEPTAHASVAFGGHQPPNRYDVPPFGPPAIDPTGDPGQQAAPTADLSDVLVNYDEVFQSVHGRYIQFLSQLMQENAELRAGFNQAVARMRDAEARLEAIQS